MWRNTTTDLLELVFVTVHNSNSQDKLLGVVVVEDAVEVVPETWKEIK